MLGTKLRALYQRKKGRDLFDLYYALTSMELDTNKLLECYAEYMAFSADNPPTQKQFMRNMEKKLEDPDFEGDIYTLFDSALFSILFVLYQFNFRFKIFEALNFLCQSALFFIFLVFFSSNFIGNLSAYFSDVFQNFSFVDC